LHEGASFSYQWFLKIEWLHQRTVKIFYDIGCMLHAHASTSTFAQLGLSLVSMAVDSAV
jgi:hypothetical protein